MIENTVAIAVLARTLVSIESIVDTVAVTVCATQYCTQFFVIAVIIAVGVPRIGIEANQGFKTIAQAVTIAVVADIQHIDHAIVVVVGRSRRIVSHLNAVKYTIAITVRIKGVGAQACFVIITQAVVIIVRIQKVRDLIAITVCGLTGSVSRITASQGFVLVGVAIVIVIGITVVTDTVAVKVSGFRAIKRKRIVAIDHAIAITVACHGQCQHIAVM